MNRLVPLQNKLTRSKSTSSIDVDGTIVDPSMGELVSSVSTMLHCQMVRDQDAPDAKKQLLPDFDEAHYTGKPIREVPALEIIYAFLKQVFEVGQFNPECCVIMLVYINRLIGVTTVPLTQGNWKPVTITALVLAQKVWEDTPLINADFSILYPALSVREINSLERKFLDLLEFKLSVPPSLYAQYYFELRSICKENSHLQPLAKAASDKIDGQTRVHLSEQYQKHKHYYRKRTMTVYNIATPISRLVLQ